MRLFPLVSPLFLLAAVRAFPASYQNDALTRTYELGGSITTVTTTLSVRATTDEPGNYKLGLARKGEEGPVAWTVTLRGKELGQVDAEVDSETGALVATVPSTLTKKDETLAIVVTEYFAYQSKPLPAAIDQDEKQFLQYSTNDTWPVTAYPTKKMSIKYRAPRKILSHSKTPTTFLPSESTSLGFKLTGSSLNLGPYRGVPASITASSKVKKHALSVHYDTSEPVLAIEELRRFVEIGAWAGNLNFEDKILLRNAGPKLKGQFRKIDLMAAQYRPEFPAQVMRELTYPLTAGAVRPYYYDNTGNISTSHFRPSPPKGGKAILELSPRFPLLGGWKHEITVGWDVQLSEWLKSLGGDKKILAVPFLTGLRGVVVDDAKLIVTLPEGAKDVQVVAPFPVDAIEHSTHKTYLDSTGRPRVTISKKFAAESHEQDIYITYTYPFYANLQKPMTVSIACLFAFSLYWIVKRMDMSIASKKAIAVKVKHE